eukprot:scaffold30403_cov53-Attheya_sp.AAC.1
MMRSLGASVLVIVIFASVYRLSVGESETSVVKEVAPEHILSFQILPHHELKERRRRERRRLGVDLDVEIEQEDTEDELALRRKHRRRLNPNGDRRQIGALYQGYGTHYLDLWVGTPPQRQTLIVDTGSQATAFPCSACQTGCGKGYHLDSPFIEANSNSFSRVDNCSDCLLGRCGSESQSCNIFVGYAEGSSWSAYEARDMVYAGGPHDQSLFERSVAEDDTFTNGDDPADASDFSFELGFGCQKQLTGLFQTQLADGILGMEDDASSFLNQMHKAGSIAERVFGLCFQRQPLASRDGTGAGVITLGSVDTRLHRSPMVYARNTRPSGWYAVHVRAVYLRQGQSDHYVRVGEDSRQNEEVFHVDVDELTLNKGEFIVDSGTTDTFLPSAMEEPFGKLFRKLAGFEYHNRPMSMTDSELIGLPTILLQFTGSKDPITKKGLRKSSRNENNQVDGLVGDLDPDHPHDVLFAVPSSHYMQYSYQTRKYTNRIYFDQDRGGVLGANIMQGHDISFDSERGRIGFAESSCEYGALAGFEEANYR